MNEYEQISAIIRSKNSSPIELLPHRTALIVVDMQRNFTQAGFSFTEVFEKISPGASSGYLKRVKEAVIPNIQKLLTCFRNLSSPVVFTAVGTEAGDGRELPSWLRAFDELGLSVLGNRVWPSVKEPGWEIDEALAPQTGEVVLSKCSAGTFATTGLELRLRHQGIDAVVITGVSSDVCVSTTAREAADRGFKTIIASDACTTLSDQMHQASLETFNIAFGWIRSSQEIIDSISQTSRATDQARSKV